MKVTISEIRPRIQVRENKTEGVLNYDTDNAYPQRVEIIAASSGTASQCIKTYAKFIEGAGFADELFYKAKINAHGLTNDKLLRKLTRDLAKFSGLAIHVNYNALFQIEEINYVPFPYVRKGDPFGEYPGMFAVYNDWARMDKKSIKKDEIDWIDTYNPNPSAIMEQVLKAGGWENYKGQIFYYGDGDCYPVAIYDAVLEDIDTDAQTQVYRNTIVRKGFSPDVVFVTPGKFEDEAEEEAFAETLKDFQGAENAASILHVQAETPEAEPKILPFPVSQNDKRFETTTRTTKDAIIEAFGIPPILLGVQVAGKLGTSGEVIDAQTFYNSLTDPERRLLEEIFTELFKRFKVQNINPSNNYSIIPFEIIKQNKNNREVLATTIGVGGVTALTGIIADTILTPEQKVNTLVILFGLTKADAEAMAKGTPLTNVQ